MIITISEPKVISFQHTMTKDDVYGSYDPHTYERLSDGLIAFRSGEYDNIFGDQVPYKSETFICKLEDETEVAYWAEYVNGANSISQRKELGDGTVALRADYMCW